MDPARRAGLRHGVVHLPVLVADRRRGRARIIEEDVTRRLVRLAFEEVALVEAIERRLDDAGILTCLDLLLQPVALGTAGDVDKGRKPVKRGKQLIDDRARLDVARASGRPAGRDSRLPKPRLSGP